MKGINNVNHNTRGSNLRGCGRIAVYYAVAEVDEEETMKKPVIIMRLHDGRVTVDGKIVQMKLPPGCIGLMFAFESKAKARAWMGGNAKLTEIEEVKP